MKKTIDLSKFQGSVLKADLAKKFVGGSVPKITNGAYSVPTGIYGEPTDDGEEVFIRQDAEVHEPFNG